MNARPFASLVLLTALVGGCGDGQQQPTETPAPPKPGAIIFSDPMDDDRNDWGTGDGEFAHLWFENGAYVFENRGAPVIGNIANWSIEALERDTVDLTDVVIRSTIVLERAGDVAGVICRGVPAADADHKVYQFVVRDGYASIRIGSNNLRTTILAERHDLSLPTGQPVAIEAACVDTGDDRVGLWLTVNGTLVLYASPDVRFGEGTFGIVSFPAPNADKNTPSIVRFLDFSVFKPA